MLEQPATRRRPAAAPALKRVRTITGFSGVYRMSPVERIALVKSGVPASEVARIAKMMDWPKERLFKLLDLPRATIDRKASSKQRLSKQQSERAVGIARLVGQVQVMVEESGDPAGFDVAKRVADWLGRPVPALGGKQPGEFMDTAEGRELVSKLLLKIQSGAYARALRSGVSQPMRRSTRPTT